MIFYNDDSQKYDGEGWYWWDELGAAHGRYRTHDEAEFDYNWYWAHM